MLYEAAINHNGYRRGARVEIPDDQLADWQYEISAGFFVPVDDPDTVPAPAPELATGQPTPEEIDAAGHAETEAQDQADAAAAADAPPAE